MSDKTGIEWTDATWNPVTGCTKVSPGCDHCYAETMHERFHSKGSFATVTLAPHRLAVPLSWRKPRRVFVNSMSDLFHNDIPDEYVVQIFAVMALAPRHTFQVLTKRHARMRSLLSTDTFRQAVLVEAHREKWGLNADLARWEWPLPNVWLGVSTEDQKWADIRIPALLDTPAAVRWISAEPLLGPIDLGAAALVPYEREQGGFWRYGARTGVHGEDKTWVPAPPAQLDWVVVGGESGPGARPMHAEWARSLRDQCRRAGTPFLFKQWGAHDASGKRVGKGKAGRQLNGRTHDEYPAAAS